MPWILKDEKVMNSKRKHRMLCCHMYAYPNNSTTSTGTNGTCFESLLAVQGGGCPVGSMTVQRV